MAIVHMISPRHFEAWDFRNPDDPGIGGSETMHVEIAWRLAALGHEVHSYVPRRPDTPPLALGVYWHDLSEVNYAAPGVFILIRGFHHLYQFPSLPWSYYHGDARRIWCVFQDVDESPTCWRDQQTHLYKIERLIALCPTHQRYLQQAHPEVEKRVFLSRNGFRKQLLQQVLLEDDVPARDPYRLTFASSPDRGLYGLLYIWPFIRSQVPEATLHVCYGFDNLEKLQQSAVVRRNTARLRQALQQPGVIVRGRLGQRALYREWLQTSVLCAPTNFHETGYITLMEAQACGVVPIVNPVWAAGDYLLDGIGIEGDAEHSALTLYNYAMAAVHLLKHSDELEDFRTSLTQEACQRFDWQAVATQYHAWLEEEAL